jgi:signal transduction histidine kinase
MEHDVLRLSEADSLYKTGRYDFHPYFYVFFDSLPNRPIEEVSDPDFQQHFFKDSSYLSKSYLGDRNRGINGLWGRLTLYADYERDQEWLISFNAGFFDLYTPDGSGHYESRRSGFGIPINDQEFGDSYGFLPCLSLYLPAQDTLTLFVKLKAVGISLFHPTHKTFDQTVFKPHAYAAKDRQVRFFDALVIGILLGVAIYHLIIFLYQRKRVSLFFSLFVVNMLFLMFLSHTYLQEFFFQETTIRRVSLMVAINWFFWYLFHYLFSRDFLQLPQYLRWGDRIWLGLILFDLLTILIALGKMFLPEDWALVSALRAIPLVMIRVWEQTLLNWVSIALALVLALKGHKAARIYLVAMLAAVLQEFVNSPNAFFGLFPLPEWIHGYAGRIITVLLFAMGIARQLKTLEEEKLAAKQAEAQEKSENQRMRELDDFKTRFYTHITHQFRTPLTIILGMAEQIRQHPTNWLNQGTKMIEHNGRRLLLLVNQILNLSKLEAGSLPVKRVQGNVVPYIRYLVESFHSFAQQKNLHLKFETPLESLVMDYDPEKLMDVLSNLIANAIKFTPVGGTVKVLVDIHENKQLQIQVADTGPGYQGNRFAPDFLTASISRPTRVPPIRAVGSAWPSARNW